MASAVISAPPNCSSSFFGIFGSSRGAWRAGFFLVGIHAPLAHVMSEHKISDTPVNRGATLTTCSRSEDEVLRGKLIFPDLLQCYRVVFIQADDGIFSLLLRRLHRVVE